MEKLIILSILSGCILNTGNGLSIKFNRNNINTSITATDVMFKMSCIIDQEQDMQRLIGLQLSRQFFDNSTESLAFINPYVHDGDPRLSPMSTWADRGATVVGGYNSSYPRATAMALALHVSQLKNSDEGVYLCEMAYWAGINEYIKVVVGRSLYVSGTVHPTDPTIKVSDVVAVFDAIYVVAGVLAVSLILNIGLIANTVFKKRKLTTCASHSNENETAVTVVPEPDQFYEQLQLDYINNDASNLYLTINQK